MSFVPLNGAVLAALRALPQGRGYRFEPAPRASLADPTNPRDPHHDGVSRDLFHAGERVAVAAADGATYCCGVTVEAFLDAWSAASEVPLGMDADEVRALIAEWFCPTMGHPGVVSALVRRGLGVPVPWRRARAGDFVQFWRSTDLAKPSGHSAVVLEVEGDRLVYLSSQPATSGVGEHTEIVGPSWEVHVVRAGFARS
jgi:hypothetical protein